MNAVDELIDRSRSVGRDEYIISYLEETNDVDLLSQKLSNGKEFVDYAIDTKMEKLLSYCFQKFPQFFLETKKDSGILNKMASKLMLGVLKEVTDSPYFLEAVKLRNKDNESFLYTLSHRFDEVYSFIDDKQEAQKLAKEANDLLISVLKSPHFNKIISARDGYYGSFIDCARENGSIFKPFLDELVKVPNALEIFSKGNRFIDFVSDPFDSIHEVCLKIMDLPGSDKLFFKKDQYGRSVLTMAAKGGNVKALLKAMDYPNFYEMASLLNDMIDYEEESCFDNMYGFWFKPAFEKILTLPNAEQILKIEGVRTAFDNIVRNGFEEVLMKVVDLPNGADFFRFDVGCNELLKKNLHKYGELSLKLIQSEKISDKEKLELIKTLCVDEKCEDIVLEILDLPNFAEIATISDKFGGMLHHASFEVLSKAVSLPCAKKLLEIKDWKGENFVEHYNSNEHHWTKLELPEGVAEKGDEKTSLVKKNDGEGK